MSGFWRYALLAFFGAVGIALALCLGLSSTVPPISPADSRRATSAAPASTSAKLRQCGNGSRCRSCGRTRSAADRASSHKPALRSIRRCRAAPPPLVNSPAASAQQGVQVAQQDQQDMMEQLRKELEKAVLKQNDSNGSGPPAPGSAQNGDRIGTRIAGLRRIGRRGRRQEGGAQIEAADREDSRRRGQ